MDRVISFVFWYHTSEKNVIELTHKSYVQDLEDGSPGRSSCYVIMGTWVKIPSPDVKILAWLSMSINTVEGRDRMMTEACLLSTNLYSVRDLSQRNEVETEWARHAEALLTYSCVQTHIHLHTWAQTPHTHSHILLIS